MTAPKHIADELHRAGGDAPTRLPRCWICGMLLDRTVGQSCSPDRIFTRDHLLPRARGSFPTMKSEADRVRNTKPCCLECNGLRARVDHCPAALMIAIGMAADTSGGKIAGLRLMGLMPTAREQLADRARRAREKRERRMARWSPTTSAMIWQVFG